MVKTWGDIFREFKKETGIPDDSILDYRPCTPPYYEVEIPNAIYVELKNGGRLVYIPKITVFEVGKCYEHTDGTKMRIIAEVDTHFYGHGLLGETEKAEYTVVGNKVEHAVNWKECEDFGRDGDAETMVNVKLLEHQKKILREFAKMPEDVKFRVRYQQEPLSRDEIDICTKCKGTGLNLRGMMCRKCSGTGRYKERRMKI